MSDKTQDTEGPVKTEQTRKEKSAAAAFKDPSQIAIAGPSQSGKTILLSALLNDQTLTNDITNPNPNPKLTANLEPPTFAAINPPASGFEKSIAGLTQAYYQIAKADDVEATGDTFTHRFVLEWQDAGRGTIAPTPNAPRRPWKTAAAAISADKKAPYQDKSFVMVDGKGGNLTGKVNTADEEAVAMAENYKQRVIDAESLILCISSRVAEEFKDEEVNNLEFLLQQRHSIMAAKSGVTLKHVALCFTKAETCFLDLGSEAFEAICDPDRALTRMPAKPYSNLIDVLSNMQHRFGVKVRAFPVSTFGFVNGTGAANFYPHAKRPGLLTRTIPEEELDQSDKTGKTWRDHFPVAISDNLAKELWKPFNVTPAFFFAATGRITGPMSFSVRQLQSQYKHG